MLLLRQSDTTLTDAAYACGFSDPKYLNRSFQKNLGMSPRQWLLENRPDPSRAPSAEDPRTAQRILTPGECRALRMCWVSLKFSGSSALRRWHRPFP